MGNRGEQLSLMKQRRDEALCRSVLYGALSLGFHPPSQESVEALCSEEARLALADAASLLMDGASKASETLESAEPGEENENLAARVNEWVLTFPSLTLEGWLLAHGRLFGHTARGIVCPYETEYGQDGLFEQPRQLATIMGFYRAFGLTTRDAERERADHVSCELEFLDFLCRKDAYALEAGDDTTQSETRKAQRLFLKDHLGRYGRAFARVLQEHDPDGFFGKLGDVLFDFLTLECRRLRVVPGASLVQLRSSEDDNVPMACGGQQDLVQLQVPQ